MGECSWSREISKTLVRADASGRLIRISVLGGTSVMRRNAPIRWQKVPHDVYIFCSTALPSVILETTSGLQVDVLDLENGPPRVHETSAGLYVKACHGPAADWASDGFARKYGYRAIPEAFQDISIRRVEDIFGVARRAGSVR